MTKYRGIRVHHKMTLAERLEFYSIPEPNTGCTLWFGAMNNGGRPSAGQPRTDIDYGCLTFNGEVKAAHVWTWEDENGPVPEGLVIRHKCDFPPCINLDHLVIGTQGDNNRDREARGRGRQPKGEAQAASKLTEAQVLAIRADPRGKRPVAQSYGVSATLIRLIRQRKKWQHI